MIKACKPKNVVLRYKIMSKCVEGDSCLQSETVPGSVSCGQSDFAVLDFVA